MSDKCFSELPVKANECREARDILEIQRIRLGAVFRFDSLGVRIRLALCSDSIGAVFGFDWRGASETRGVAVKTKEVAR